MKQYSTIYYLFYSAALHNTEFVLQGSPLVISTCIVQTNAIYQHAAGIDSNLQLSSSAKAACAASPLKLPSHYKKCSPPLFCFWQGASQGGYAAV
jgi:hypothetical protein